MENLAGNPRATQIVSKELERVGVPIEVLEHTHSEVPALVRGKLGTFTFDRAWYYYIVKGEVPLSVAQKLYEHPVGRTDIRVAGHCGCPPPEEWCRWYDQYGTLLTSTKDIEQTRKYVEGKEDGLAYESLREWLKTIRPIEDVPVENRKGIVESYHIDSELGLYIFIEAIKQAELV